MNKKYAKEALIIALLFMVIIFTIAILFYDFLPISGDRIKSIKYVSDENVKQTLEDVSKQSSSGSSDSVLKSYEIKESDLTSFSTEKTYESGKKDPFSTVSDPVSETVTTTKSGASTTNPQASNPLSPEKSEKVAKEDTNKNTVADKKDSKNENTASTNIIDFLSNTTNSVVPTNTISTENKTSENKTTATNTVEKKDTTGTFFESKNSK